MTSFWQHKEKIHLGLSSINFLQKSAKDSLDVIQRLKLESKVEAHNGCVNTICWNKDGSLLLSGSDDQHLDITDPFTQTTLFSVHSGHRANIFSAKFLPNSSDKKIVSCSGDGIICVTHIDRLDTIESHKFDCHFGTVYEVITVENDSHTFLSCGEDGTVRWFDQRIKSKCNKTECKEDVLISCRGAVSAISINPMAPNQLAVGCSDSVVRLYDRRFLGTKATGNDTGNGVSGLFSCFTAPGLEKKSHRITSVKFDSSGQKLLVSYSSDYLYLFDMTENVEKKLSCDSKKPTTENEDVDMADSNGPAPPIKRLRLRGDWSDTGPGARPESERSAEGNTGRISLMQRMSEMLTRWFEDRVQQNHYDDQDPANNDDEPDNSNERQEHQASENQSNSESQEVLETTGNDLSSVDLNVAVESEQNATGCQDIDEPVSEAHCSNKNQSYSDRSNTGVSHADSADPVPSTIDSVNQSFSRTLPVINFEYDTQGMNNSTVEIGIESDHSTPVACSSTSAEIKVPKYPSKIGNVCDATPSCSNEESKSNPNDEVSDDIDETGNEPMASVSQQQDLNVSLPTIVSEDEDDDDNDSDNDEDRSLPSRQRVQNRADMARKIQRMYRKRQEEKRLEEESLRNRWQPKLKTVFRGHRNARTMIKEANFWGNEYVISGSDCGHIFFWNQRTGKLVNLLEGDKHVVNCVQPHPFDPTSSGIDYDIKLWTPSNPECVFAAEDADKLMSRNELMLEETRDTITVPASFMLRMLASLNHIRSGRRAREELAESNSSSENDNL